VQLVELQQQKEGISWRRRKNKEQASNSKNKNIWDI